MMINKLNMKNLDKQTIFMRNKWACDFVVDIFIAINLLSHINAFNKYELDLHDRWIVTLRPMNCYIAKIFKVESWGETVFDDTTRYHSISAESFESVTPNHKDLSHPCAWHFIVLPSNCKTDAANTYEHKYRVSQKSRTI